MESAREAVSWLERHAAYTRTGHHSARTGEWRDGGGLVASLFLHHLSRDGDPQLHVHVAIWNRIQRADGADDKWRTLDSRVPARPAARRRPGRGPDPGDQAVRARLRHGAPGRRQRRRGRRGQPGRDGPVQLPRRRRHRRAGPPRTGVPGGARQAAVTAHAVAAAPAGRAEHPAHQERRPAAPSPGRPAPRNPPRRSASPPGKPRPCTAKCTRCPRCMSRLPGSPPAARRACTRPCWMMRPSARPRGSRSRKCKSSTRSGRWLSSGSRCTGRSRSSSPAPTARRWSPRWPSWPSPAGPAPKSSRSPPPTSPT